MNKAVGKYRTPREGLRRKKQKSIPLISWLSRELSLHTGHREMRNPVYQMSFSEFIHSLLNKCYWTYTMYWALPTPLEIDPQTIQVKKLLLLRHTPSWESSELSAAAVYGGPTMCQIFWWTWQKPIAAPNSLCKSRLVISPKKWSVSSEVDTQPSR